MTWLKDTAERVGRTAAATWLGAWLAISGHDFPDLWSHDVLLTTASASALTLLACLGASKVNDQNTASFQKQPPKG